MGVVFYIGCLDCKICRDLGKFYELYAHDLSTKEELEKLTSTLYQEGAALLVSFLADHLGHKCVAFPEGNETLKEVFGWELCNLDNFNEDSSKFWRKNPND